MRRLYLFINYLAVIFKTSKCLDWCYQSQVSCAQPCNGPKDWPEVYKTCGGNRQSPINIVTKLTKDAQLGTFKFTGYNEKFYSMLKIDSHTVSLDIPLGAKVSGGSLPHTYNAIKLLFHWGNYSTLGSEHAIDGERYPMELHIVHIKDTYITVEEARNDPSGQAILAFFFEETESENKNYIPFFQALKSQALKPGSQTLLGSSLNNLILPENQMMTYYRYEGSETMPGCSESAIWTVFQQPIPLNRLQLSVFFGLDDNRVFVDTFRPVQPRKGREVYFSRAGAAVTSSFALVLVSLSTALGYY